MLKRPVALLFALYPLVGAASVSGDSGGPSGPLSAISFDLYLSSIGLVFLAIAFFGRRHRLRQLFEFLVLYGVVLLLSFPMGTAVGVTILAFCFRRRREFLKANEPPKTKRAPGALTFMCGGYVAAILAIVLTAGALGVEIPSSRVIWGELMLGCGALAPTYFCVGAILFAWHRWQGR